MVRWYNNSNFVVMYIWPHVNGILASDNNTTMRIFYGLMDHSGPFTNYGLAAELAAVSFFSIFSVVKRH